MFVPRTALALSTAAALSIGTIAPAHAVVVEQPVYDQDPSSSVKVSTLGSYDTGVFDKSAAEIVAFHAASKRILTVNATSGKIDVLDASDLSNPTKVGEVSGGENTTINSVAVRADGLAVATVGPVNKTDDGELIFFDAGAETPGEVLGRVSVGALPDMVAMTPAGDYALVANEGEPAEDYSVDPEGTVSVIALPSGVAAATQDDVRTADFRAFEGTLAAKGVHIFGQVGASTSEAQNLEPEYITVDGGKAYVTLQENNAIAVVDIASATVEDVWPLGYIDRREVPFDASDKDEKINITTWPVKSILQPDAIAAYNVDDTTYLVLANEGDARDWDGYSEEARLKKFGSKGIAPICEGYAGLSADHLKELQSDKQLGRLNMTTALGLNEEKGCYDDLYNFGGRGFSIFTADGTRVFDTGADFEQITARILPENFNSNHTETSFETRSDDKGPEPEGVTLGEINGRTYAFIGLERLGGVMVYDVTDPAKASYQAYINNRDFSVNMKELEGDEAVAQGLSKVGDLGAEGLTFVTAKDSPNGENLLIVGNEVSGTTTIFQVDSLLPTSDADPAPAPAPQPAGSSKGNALAVALSAIIGGIFVISGLAALFPGLNNLLGQLGR